MSDTRLDLFGDKSRQRSENGYGAINENDPQLLERQQQLMQAQENSLEQLSQGVSSVRKIAEIVHGEVNVQNGELDDVGLRMNRLENRVDGANEHARDMQGSAYTIRSFCMLLWPLVLLIVLVVEAVLHFIF